MSTANTVLKRVNFSDVEPQHTEKQLKTHLADNLQLLNTLLSNNTQYTWDNLMAPLEEADDALSRFWSPVSHLNSVMNSDALRDAYQACLPHLSDHSTTLGQHEALYAAVSSISTGDGFAALDTAKQKVIEHELRDFKLAGVALPDNQKARYAEITKLLSTLTSKYSDNVLDATNAWTHHIEDQGELAGLPAHAIAQAQEAAEAEGKTGYLLTLQFPCYYAVITQADNRALRQKLYDAYVTRASDVGTHTDLSLIHI